MSVLAIEAGPAGVVAAVVDDDGTVVATGRHGLATQHPAPGHVELAPDELWRATLAAVRTTLEQVDASALRGVGLTHRHGAVVLWDRETLGSPRPAITTADRRADGVCARLQPHEGQVTTTTGLILDPRLPGPALAWLAEHEPRTWALVASGRYAVGTLESYLLARMTRGLEHATDVASASRTLLLDLGTGEWDDDLCGLLEVPRDALPEIVPSWGRLAVTDPRSFAGLDLPVTGLVGEPAALLLAEVATIDHGEGDGDADGTWSLAATGTTPVAPGPGWWTTAAWRTPTGTTTYAVERPWAGPPPTPRPEAALRGAAVAARRGLAPG